MKVSVCKKLETKKILSFTIDSQGNTALLYTDVNINLIKRKLKWELVIIDIYLITNGN